MRYVYVANNKYNVILINPVIIKLHKDKHKVLNKSASLYTFIAVTTQYLIICACVVYHFKPLSAELESNETN